MSSRKHITNQENTITVARERKYGTADSKYLTEKSMKETVITK